MIWIQLAILAILVVCAAGFGLVAGEIIDEEER